MTEVDHSEGDEMSPQEVNILPVKANQQVAKLVYPGKRPLSHETVFIHLFVE
jgi:hypothetical protein